MKIYRVGAELCRADGQTDIQRDMRLIVAFRNFGNAPENRRACYFFSIMYLRRSGN